MADTAISDPFAGNSNPFDAIGFEGGPLPSGGGNTTPILSPSNPHSGPGSMLAPDDIDTSGDSAPPLTVTRGRSSAVVPTQNSSGSGASGLQAPSDPFAGNANPFDTIGFEPGASSQSGSAPVSTAGNSWALGVLANNPAGDSFMTGALKNAGTTAIRGVSHAPGFVGDLGNFADTLMEAPEFLESKITGQPFADVVAKRNALAAESNASTNNYEKGLFGFSLDPRQYFPSGSEVAAPVLRETGTYRPTTALGQYGSAAGEAVLGSLGPGGGGLTPTSIFDQAVPNALAGVSSQAVANATGDPLLSAMAGIGVAGAGGAGYESVRNAPARKAASILSAQTTDPVAATAAISAGRPDLIPDVQPTTAEMTGDPGLYRLQSQVAENNPALFSQRRAQQDQGRLAALDALMPGGDPDRVANAFQQQFDDIGDQTQAMVDQHLAAAQGQADALRGQGLPIDAYGADLQNRLADAQAAKRQAEGELWDAVDPDGKLTNDTTGIKQASKSIYGNLPAADRAFMSPAESTFSNLIDGLNDVEPFRQVASLKSNMAAAMRKELRDNGRTPAYARMSTLMGPVQDAINGTVARRAAADNAAVAAGQMVPENTLGAKLDEILEQHQSQARSDTGADARRTVAAAGSGPAPLVPSDGRANSEGNPRFGTPSSDQAVPRDVAADSSQAVGRIESSASTMNPDAAARLKAANDATKARAQTFGAKPISDILAESGGRGNYTTPPSAVPGKLFKKGPGGFEVVDAFRKAVGDDKSAMHVLRDHALDDMRRSAIAPDGTLDPAKITKWQADHADALRAFPELADKFRDAAAATTTYQEAAAQRRDLIKAYQKSAFGKLMNASHPEEVTALIGTMLKQPNRATVFRKLTEAASRDPMALAGLRQAVLDHIVGKSVADIETASGPTRSIKAKTFSDLVKSSRVALEEVLGKPSTNMLNRIADSLPKVSHAVEDAGQKHADIVRYLKAASRSHETLLERMVKLAFVAREVGENFGGAHGAYLAAGATAAGMIGKKAIDAIRATGARKVGDLLTDAVLNPEQYAALLKQAPPQPDTGTENALAFQLRRAAMFGTDAMGKVAAHAASRAPRLNDRAERRDRRVPHLARGGGLLGMGGGNGPLGVPSLISGSTKKAMMPFASGGRVEPTDAQKEAGNYKKDHVRFEGLDIAIENRKGSERSSVGKDGKRWTVQMPADYGYIKGTVGADGDHVDCYLGPATRAKRVYVIDQKDAQTGKFDEHKCMLGFMDQHEAVTTYKRGFSDGRGADRLMKVTPMTLENFKDWVF